MKLKVTRIKSTNDNMRTKDMIGEGELPTLGEPFVLIGKSLTSKKGIRRLETTPVKIIEKNPQGLFFQTLNSRYKLDILDD